MCDDCLEIKEDHETIPWKISLSTRILNDNWIPTSKSTHDDEYKNDTTDTTNTCT